MGRSFSRVGDGPGQHRPEPGVFQHEPSRRTYSIEQRGGRFFLRRAQTGFQDAPTNVLDREIHYVAGSGNHARTYIHRRADGALIELPVSWYSDGGGYWAMSPGYDRPDHFDFRRPVSDQCLFCHNGYPAVAPPGELAGGIDCQRCHGPGVRHVESAGKGLPLAEVRAAIVNPSRFSRDRQLEVCFQCHLQTTSRALPHALWRFGREPFSYRPDEPLADAMLHFDHPAGSAHSAKFEVNSAAYRMRQSRCFTAPGSTLTCTTCHNPHEAFRGEEASAKYRAACLSCHEAVLRRATSDDRHTSQSDCAACHMPKRRSEDAVHVVITDHRIGRAAGAEDYRKPLDELAFAQAAAYQGEVHLYYPPQLPDTPDNRLYRALAQIKDMTNPRSGIPTLERLLAAAPVAPVEFSLELAEALAKAGEHERAARHFQRVIDKNPRLPRAWRGLGESHLRRRQPERVIPLLEEGRRAAAEHAGILTVLGVAYGQVNRIEDSVNVLRAAVTADPDLPLAWLNLAVSLEQAGRPTEAEAAYREAIRVQPDFRPAHSHLANLLEADGRTEEAAWHRRQ